MQSSTTNIFTCNSYERAVQLFQDPPRRGKKWSANERPLGSAAQYHYRVERNGDGSYSVWLYRTCMARFHPPVPYGERRVDLTWDNRSTSVQFMRRVLGMNWCTDVETTCGRAVYLALKPGHVSEYTYAANGKLILNKSTQAVLKRKVRNPKAKEWLAEAKERLSPLTNLLELRVEQDTADAEAATKGYREGAAFRTNPEVNRVLHTLCSYDPVHGEWEAFVEPLKDLYAAAIRGLVASRERKEKPKAWSRSERVEYKPPTPKAATTAFFHHIEKLSKMPAQVSEPAGMWCDTDAFAQSSIAWY